jgi:hypothetical protein
MLMGRYLMDMRSGSLVCEIFGSTGKMPLPEYIELLDGDGDDIFGVQISRMVELEEVKKAVSEKVGQVHPAVLENLGTQMSNLQTSSTAIAIQHIHVKHAFIWIILLSMLTQQADLSVACTLR